MAAPRRRTRKATPIEPVPVPDVPATVRRESPGLYHEESFADGSVRPVRNTTRAERESGQALADFFGVEPQLNPAANVRSMESVLATLISKMDISIAEHAPEVLADAWAKAVGPFLATKAELISVARKQARIRTSHPAVRFELTRQKAAIIRALNATLGEGAVTSVVIVHG
ncbi:MAG: DUF721 domain-containing protein [Akkermansia sp.]|nr:DUF721 domain-containing protein [Akkermansia sp.]